MFERVIFISIHIDSVFTSEQDALRDGTERIGSDVIPVFVRRKCEIIPFPLIAGNSFFGQYPDVMLFVFGNLMNQVVRQRVRVVFLAVFAIVVMYAVSILLSIRVMKNKEM